MALARGNEGNQRECMNFLVQVEIVKLGEARCLGGKCFSLWLLRELMMGPVENLLIKSEGHKNAESQRNLSAKKWN
jgi:hypothetical protein